MAKYLETKSGSIEEAIRQVNEKSVSQAQQMAAGAALSAKRGESSPSELVGASKQMYDNMTEKELEDFAKTKHKDLPKKVEEVRQLKDPKKETMVSKKGKVEVIDKKDLKKYLSKGYIQAESNLQEKEMTYTVVHVKKGKEVIKAKSSYDAAKKFAKMKGLKSTAGVDSHIMENNVELEEGYYDVVFKDKSGKVEKDGKGFKDKAKAQRFADKGNKIKGVQGTYVVYHVKGKADKVLEDLDKVNPVAVKKKFDDRKDKDIDNDGDVDTSDKYLHKRRKAISKAVAKEEVVKEYNEIGTPEYTKHTLEVTPGQQDADWDKQVNIMHKKSNSMREALAQVWGMKEGKNPFKKEEEKPLTKTMTGEKTTKVEVDPKIKG